MGDEKKEPKKEPKSNEAVVAGLERIKNQSEEELYFDPTTGQLVVKRPNEEVDPDAVAATQMAREGFFAEKTPQATPSGKGGRTPKSAKSGQEEAVPDDAPELKAASAPPAAAAPNETGSAKPGAPAGKSAAIGTSAAAGTPAAASAKPASAAKAPAASAKPASATKAPAATAKAASAAKTQAVASEPKAPAPVVKAASAAKAPAAATKPAAGAEKAAGAAKPPAAAAKPAPQVVAPPPKSPAPATERTSCALVYGAELSAFQSGEEQGLTGPCHLRDDGDLVIYALGKPIEDFGLRGVHQASAAVFKVPALPQQPSALAVGQAEHVLAVSPGGLRSWSRRGKKSWQKDDLEVVPDWSDALSRNRGILETDQLAKQCVAVVGLGSGGSQIAMELAKAGVGHLILIDRDRIELGNVGRHVCDLADLGRRKTAAMRERILRKNPHARIEIFDMDIVKAEPEFRRAVAAASVIVAATDGNRSRRVLNRASIEAGKTTIFGRAYTRAAGGDVLRIRPGDGPCYECILKDLVVEEEATSAQSEHVPAYSDVPVKIEPGLSMDIAPIALMMARLTVVELVRGSGSALESLDEDLPATMFMWANRREGQFEAWEPMRYSFGRLSVQRWYSIRTERDAACPACNEEGFLASLEAEAV